MRTLLSADPAVTPGTWNLVNATIPDADGAHTMMLLSDGTAMVQGGGGQASKFWYQLKPDAAGGYLNGTWSQLASMNLERLFFPSQMLPDGRYFVVGGEYSGPLTHQNFANTGEIYNPQTNSWTNITNFPRQIFGDDPTAILPDGRVLAGYLAGPETYIYDPATNSWSQTGTKLRNDASDEETWVMLPDHSILSYDIFASAELGVGHAQRYIPSQGAWVDAGTLPFQLSAQSLGFELGPAFLLPDGRVIFFGGNNNTAFYTPSSNSWSAGPNIPNGLACDDTPGAVLPNGHVLFAASPPTSSSNPFPGPTSIFEFDPVSNTFTDVTPTNFDLSEGGFVTMMLVLPTGQVMLVNDTRQIDVYTPSGSPNDAWRPTITNISADGDKTFTLTGTQLNGISEGATYGDDAEMSTNFPIVRLRDASGHVFYARTFNWSNTGVATGDALVSTQFTLPAGLPLGIYGVTVIANGIPSAEVQANLGGIQVPDISQLEGNSGTTDFVFTVTLPQAAALPTIVQYSTSDGTATLADSDYIAATGAVTFAPGETIKQITVQVIGDTKVEGDETFMLDITVQGASIGNTRAIGTILNDDVYVSVNDITVFEGDSGTSNAVFTVSVQGTSHATTLLGYVTSDDTANAGSDYVPVGGALAIPPLTASAQLTVPIIGDKANEANEDFFLTISNLQNATVLRALGVCTIIDNDPLPMFYVNDVQVTENQQGTFDAVFTVALDRASGRQVTVAYATADGTAHEGTDYTGESGVLTFAPGINTTQVTVPVLTSATYGPNETFFLNLSDPTNAVLGDASGTGTIVFAAATPLEQIIDNGDPGFSETPGWTDVTNLLAYKLDYDYHAAGGTFDKATWSFNNLPNGTYQVFTRWVQFSNRATNAPYTVFDGSTSLGTVLVNQQLAPTGDSENGVTWQSIGSYQIANNQLVVRLGANANGYVIADAVRIVANGIPQQVPEIDVAGSGVSIGVGDSSPQAADGTEFGSVLATTDSAVHTFKITNTGNAPLHLTSQPTVQLGGNNPQDFVIVSQPAVSIAPGSSSTFQVLFHPTTTGLREAVISIANDDSDESLYQFVIEGTGTNGPVGVPLAHNAALPVDVNNDQLVSARDAIIVINALNRPAPAAGALVATADAVATPAAATDAPTYFVDVDGDGIVTPHDAIMVINYLIRHPLATTALASPAVAPAAAPAAQPQVQAFAITDEAVSQSSDSSSSPPPPTSQASTSSAATTDSASALTPEAVDTAFETAASQDDQDSLSDVLG